MPRRKKLSTSPKAKIAPIEKVSPEFTMMQKPRPSALKYIIIAVLVLLAILILKYKNLFVVATVNGKPITRLDLEKELNSKYGAQTLDNLISEQIILSEAGKKGITVSESDINKKISDIENTLKGKMTLSEALKSQGLTMDDLRKQIAIQLTIDKMFEKQVTVTDKDIDDYIAQNKESLQSSTDPAKLRTQIAANLRQQKIGDLFDKWFTDIKAKAKVVKF